MNNNKQPEVNPRELLYDTFMGDSDFSNLSPVTKEKIFIWFEKAFHFQPKAIEDATEFYKDDFNSFTDRILRDKGASNKEIYDANNAAFEELKNNYTIIKGKAIEGKDVEALAEELYEKWRLSGIDWRRFNNVAINRKYAFIEGFKAASLPVNKVEEDKGEVSEALAKQLEQHRDNSYEARILLDEYNQYRSNQLNQK